MSFLDFFRKKEVKTEVKKEKKSYVVLDKEPPPHFSFNPQFRIEKKGVMDNQLTPTEGIHPNIQGFYDSQGFIGYAQMALFSQRWLVNRACEIKGQDAVRQGYKFKFDEGNEVAPEVHDYLKEQDIKYRIKYNLLNADKMNNVFGIRHVLFIVDGANYEKPFNLDGIRVGSYKGIAQIDPYWLVPSFYDANVRNPASPDFYEPDFWQVGNQKIHKSWFIILRGAEVPDILKPAYIYGGISLVQRVYERAYAAETSANEIQKLLMSKRLVVRKMDLEEASQNPARFKQALDTMINFRDNFGTLAIGTDEDISELDTSLAGVGDVISNSYNYVAAICGVPVNKFMKTQITGFNSAGVAELKDYHEEVKNIQENVMRQIMERHYACLARSDEFLIKNKIDKINFEFNPIDILNDEELANIQKLKSESMRNYSEAGALDPDEIHNMLVSDPLGGMTGLEEVDTLDAVEDIDKMAVDFIRKEDDKYYIFSEKGKKLSKGYSNKKEAHRRLREIEYFKTKDNCIKVKSNKFFVHEGIRPISKGFNTLKEARDYQEKWQK